MKRDWHLLGKIFEEIENETFEKFLDKQEAEEQVRILRHTELLVDAGYIVGITVRYDSSGVPLYGIESGYVRITLAGYDFAERVQDTKLLNKTMSLIKKAGLLVSMETLKQFTPIAVTAIAQAVSGG